MVQSLIDFTRIGFARRLRNRTHRTLPLFYLVLTSENSLASFAPARIVEASSPPHQRCTNIRIAKDRQSLLCTTFPALAEIPDRYLGRNPPNRQIRQRLQRGCDPSLPHTALLIAPSVARFLSRPLCFALQGLTPLLDPLTSVPAGTQRSVHWDKHEVAISLEWQQTA